MELTLNTTINYKTEDYIRQPLGRMHRAILAQFRSGILPLRIETGRWKNEGIEARVCLVCEENIVGDEYHFLCVYKMYDDVRQVLYSKISSKYQDIRSLTSIDKFIFLMKYENIEVDKYLVKAFGIRKACP